MNVLIATISKIRIGTPKAYRNLTVFPLLDGGGAADYLILDEALAQGSAKVTEVSEGGSVPQLAFANSGAKRVFLLDGEELVGAKQNRVLNLTILAPAEKTIVIPVSCVEAGRWHRTSAAFASAPRTQYAEGRASKLMQVSLSLEHGSRASDQGEVWRDIGRKFGKFGFHSPTSSMSDLYDAETARVEDFVRAFAAENGQAGAMFAVGGRLFGFDVFDAPETFRKLFAKLLRSYALDAIAESRAMPRPEVAQPLLSHQDAEAFLKAVAEAEATRFPAVGEGQDVRLKGKGISGAALIVDGRVVHLAAFRQDGHGRDDA